MVSEGVRSAPALRQEIVVVREFFVPGAFFRISERTHGEDDPDPPTIPLFTLHCCRLTYG